MPDQHTVIVRRIDDCGVGLDLRCDDHDPEACDLQSWWVNESPEDLVDLRALDIEIPVDVEWIDQAPLIVKRVAA